MINKNQVVIFGRHAVLAAIKNPARKIKKVLCVRENFEELKNLVSADKLQITDRREIEKLLAPDAVHQGFVMIADMLPAVSLEEICSRSEFLSDCHLVILDQVTDPQNIGAIIRSCAAFNSLALIVQDKNSPQESGSMLKAAAGTFENMPVCRVTNLVRAIEKLKQSGFWIIGMDGYAKAEIKDTDKRGKIAVIMGSEGKGMRRLTEENCDMCVRLPINPDVESLNVSTAAAIVLYELNRKE
ncbi:MAG: 23S rRNA (guanosine(2251)-2'-O)-methyltransferase RlmB [Alphaproteobacteria bacterium]|nr:23S rRNA (guanosine(2251)-2'-O)-methyltransferase RlmB [Alphaproteobacteria bacterium]